MCANLKFLAFSQHIFELNFCQSVKAGEPTKPTSSPRTAHDTNISNRVKRDTIGTHTPSSVAKPSFKEWNTNLIARICGKAMGNLGNNFFLCHISLDYNTKIKNIIDTTGNVAHPGQPKIPRWSKPKACGGMKRDEEK